MNNFEFLSPTKIYFGKNQEENVGKIIKENGFKKILLHYGGGSIKKIGVYEKIIKSLKENNVDFFEVGGVLPNPKIDLVRNTVKFVKKENIDFILAVGGGSVIDSAKAIACGAMVDFDPWLFNIHEKVVTNALPVGVILTISAAGSELSNSCVISNLEYNIKNGFNSELVRPIFAIMNPEITYSVSKYQTACGIVDIMMHTLERYFSENDDLIFTEEIALGLIRSTIDAGRRVMKNPNDYNARAALMIASSFSHNGLTGLGSKYYFTVHKLEHILSGLYDEISHGAGLAILFPAWAKYTVNLFKDKWIKLASRVFDVEVYDPLESIIMLENYFEELQMPITLSEVNVKEEDFVKILNLATKNNTTKIPAIKPLDYDDIKEILYLAK